MKREEKELLSSIGFQEDRSFFRTWSKETDYFYPFPGEKEKLGKIWLEILELEDQGRYRFSVNAQVEDTHLESLDGISSFHLFDFSCESISEGLEKTKIYLDSFFTEFHKFSGKLI